MEFQIIILGGQPEISMKPTPPCLQSVKKFIGMKSKREKSVTEIVICNS